MAQYTAVIVEDEIITLNELLLTIPWEALSLKIAGTAMNGIDGEAVIKKEAPDIVITDIKLPGQDGLEMLSKCPIDYAIIVSGHTDFAYAKRAIKLGVVNYLEKPVDDDELIDTLKLIVSKMREESSSIKKSKLNKGLEIISLPDEVNNHSINLAISYIKEHYKESFGLQDIAEYANISENHLSSLFRDVAGINFLHYLNGYRINKSAEILKTTTLNISEIAELCGFPTPSYFTKIFRKYAGMTPTQYRDSIFSQN